MFLAHFSSKTKVWKIQFRRDWKEVNWKQKETNFPHARRARCAFCEAKENLTHESKESIGADIQRANDEQAQSTIGPGTKATEWKNEIFEKEIN